MSELSVEEQYELDLAIGNRVLGEMYEEENSAELTIEIDDEDIHYRLTSDSRLIIVPEDELVEAIVNFVTVNQRAQTNIVKVVYRFQKDPDGRWDVKASFTHRNQSQV